MPFGRLLGVKSSTAKLLSAEFAQLTKKDPAPQSRYKLLCT